MNRDRNRTMWLWRAVIVAALAAPVTLAGPKDAGARAAHEQSDHGVFRDFAERLLSGIGAAKFSDIPAIGGYGRPRIAVLPFSKDETGLPPWVTDDLNNRLLSALTRQGSRFYRFVARDALKSIIKDIDATGELDPGSDERVKDLLRNARVDILIVGKIRTDGDGIVLSYKAVSIEDGTLFAATGPRHIDGPLAGLSPRPADRPAPNAPPVHAQRPPAPLAAAPSPVPLPRPRPTVRRAQRLLADLGYHPGPADGVMRPRTRAAIRAFQRDEGLIPHGRLTRAVMGRLRRSLRLAEIAP